MATLKVLDFFPPQSRDWVAENTDLIDAIFETFQATGDWPEPTQLQRELLAQGSSTRIRSGHPMPQELGNRSWNPPRIRLTLLGLGCCPAARPLMASYVEVLRLALDRFGKPHEPSELCRADVDAALDLTPEDANRLSQVISDDCPFLGSGSSSPTDWRREIDEGVLDFEGVDGVDAFLARLAEFRVNYQVAQIPKVDSEDLAIDETGLNVTLAIKVLGATASLYALLFLPWWMASTALCATTVALLHRHIVRDRPKPAALAVAVAAFLVPFGYHLATDSPMADDHAYLYFADTDQFVRTHIAPAADARELLPGPITGGDQVLIDCIADGIDGSGKWGKLTDGTFLPLEILIAEAETDQAPAC